MEPHDHDDVALDASDPMTRGVGRFLAGLTIGVLVTLGLARVVFDVLESRAERRDERPLPIVVEAGHSRPPAPILQVSPPRDMGALRAREDARLSGYGWVDRAGGVVRIPIDRAIEVTAERGLPVRRETR